MKIKISDYINLSESDRWVLPFFKKNIKVLSSALLLGFLSFLFAAGLMFTSGYLISSAAALPESILILNIPLMFVRVFGIGKPILAYFERLFSHDWVLRMTSELRLKLFKAVEKRTTYTTKSHQAGDIVGLLTDDIGHLQNLYLRTVLPLATGWLLWFALLVFAGFFSWALLAALFILVTAIAFVIPMISLLYLTPKRKRLKILKAKLYTETTDNILGVSDWIFSGRSKDYIARYRAIEDSMRELETSEQSFARTRDALNQLLLGLCILVLLVWAALRFGGIESPVADWIAAFTLGFFPLFDAFLSLSYAATDVISHRDSLERLNQLSDGEEVNIATEGLPFHYDIAFNKVTYAYPLAENSLYDDFSLTIPQKQKVMLLGRSGVGKSTLAALLHGDITPQSGKVLLGGIQPSALHHAISSYIGVIQQSTYLFNRTLLENVRIARTDATEEEVASVLNRVGLTPLVERLPQGLHTVVQEGGTCFSGGECHRLALARVLLQDVPVVILDEPCTGLDPETEQMLLMTLLDALSDKTIIMITHHLAGASLFDRVIFLESGKISLDGHHNDLKDSSEKYRQLLNFDQEINL